jgi:hypothetical protein
MDFISNFRFVLLIASASLATPILFKGVSTIIGYVKHTNLHTKTPPIDMIDISII